jgi:hypothetical protein
MPWKCPCRKKEAASKTNFANKLEENARELQKKDERVLENYRILRVEIYESLMKNFFKQGKDYRQFSRQHFPEGSMDIKYKSKFETGQ